MKKTLYIILGLVAVAAIVGGYMFPKVQRIGGAASPAGSVQSVQQLAEVTWLATTIPTTTAILNSSYDRAVTDSFVYCTGVTNQPAVNTWTLTAATGSAVTTTNTNYVQNVSIGTTTSNVYVASSTFGNDIFRLWPAGTYLDFAFNATNTATCTIGVHYIAL